MSKSGQVKILAVTAPKRLTAAPDVPTLTEFGTQLRTEALRGPGTPQKKIAQYNEVLEKCTRSLNGSKFVIEMVG